MAWACNVRLIAANQPLRVSVGVFVCKSSTHSYTNVLSRHLDLLQDHPIFYFRISMMHKLPSPAQPDTQRALMLSRELATYANMMDSLVRIPFTRQGIGADAAVGTIPVVGDVAGLALASYAIYQARQIGVPWHKLAPAVKLAVLDVGVGFVPVLGDAADIFIRPSRRAVNIVHEHLQTVHGIDNTDHLDHPVLHQALEKRQAQSAFWRNPVVAWLWLRIPDLIGTVVLVWLVLTMYYAATWLMGLF